MKFRLSATLVVCAAALWTLQSARVRTQSAPSHAVDLDDFQGRQVVAHEVLVRVRPGATLGPLHALVDAVDDRPVGSQGWHRIRSSSRLVQELITRLKGRFEVLDIEPNYIVHTTAVPNDTLFPNLWGMLNNTTPGADIHATAAWNAITGSTANVVGVVDTGIDYTHPDLAANVWSAPTAFTVTLSGGSGVTISCPAGSHGFNAITNSCDPKDDNIHGTHVSGTIGAVGNNGAGVAGVNWTTRIMGLKFLDANGSGSTSDAVDAIDFAIQTKAYFAAHGGGASVRVLSNSWGGGGSSNALNQEIAAANNANMLFVAAAGNAGTNNDNSPFYPASYTQPNMIAVAASNEVDTLAGFSNFGPTKVHLAAPGTNIVSTVPGGGYQGLNGTSMATPHVAGAAMLVLSACNLTTAQVKSAILNNVDAVASLQGLIVTGGRLNVDRAVRSCATIPTVVLTNPANNATFAPGSNITLGANASDPDGVNRVEFYQGTTLIGTSNSSPFGGTWNNVAAGTYTLTAKGYDTFGVVGVSAPVSITVSAPNTPAAANFVRTDSTTLGNWRGVYGSDGYNVVGDTVSYPAYAAVTTSGTNYWPWADSTTDPRALQRASGSNRIAATWYGGVFSLDVNVLDGKAHQLALYVIDWDNMARTERLEVHDATTNALLDSRTVSAFSGGKYVVWTVQGHVVISVINVTGTNAVVSGVFFDAASANLPPAVSMTAPADNANFVAPATISLSANASDSDGITRVEFYQGASLIATSTNGLADGSRAYTATWSNVAAGSYTLTAKAYDASSSALSTVSGAVHVTVTTAGSNSTSTFVGTDTTTRGTWKGVYGTDGAVLVNDSTTLPPYATVTTTAANWTWAASTADVRALQKKAGSDRIAATWYAAGTAALDVNLTDGAPHRVSLYVVDWDNVGRVERVDVRDAATNALLDSRTVSGFGGGTYLSWTMQGHVVINVVNVAGVNAVVSGIFFDTGGGGTPPPATTSATFVGTDTTTLGTWKGVYGTDGAVIVNDSTTLPAYAALTTTAPNWTWAGSSADARALQKKSLSDRIAATWYGWTVPLDVNLVDGASHRVSIYLLDWDSGGRVERVDIRDAATNALLDSRTVNNFAGGLYLTWMMQGHVVINVAYVSGTNAVVSGVFFN